MNGPDELKEHPWFQNFDWTELYNKQMPSPFIPQADDDNFDEKYINQDWKDANSEQMM